MSGFSETVNTLVFAAENPNLCAVGRFAGSSELDADDKASLDGLLFHSNVSTYQVHDLLRSHGVKVSRDMVQRHRDGRCRCEAQ